MPHGASRGDRYLALVLFDNGRTRLRWTQAERERPQQVNELILDWLKRPTRPPDR